MHYLKILLATLIATTCFSSCSFAKPHHHVYRCGGNYTSQIIHGGGRYTRQLLHIYAREGKSCYIGDHGSSFGPFQFHYARGGGAIGNKFTHDTGLNARNQSTVGAQIQYMVRWGHSHFNQFSSAIWHGLRNIFHRRHHSRFHHWRHHSRFHHWHHHHHYRHHG